MRKRRFRTDNRVAVNICLAVLILMLYCAASIPPAYPAMSNVYGNPITRGSRRDTIALECAVNWNTAFLPEMLDTLEEAEVPVTFFVTGSWAKENREELARMLRMGHEIGVMEEIGCGGDYDALLHSVRSSRQTIADLCGIQPTLYYSGWQDERVSGEVARALGMRQVLCSVDLLSARGSAQDVLGRALEAPFDGSIILMQPTAAVTKALPVILSAYKEQGWNMMCVGQTLYL